MPYHHFTTSVTYTPPIITRIQVLCKIITTLLNTHQPYTSPIQPLSPLSYKIPLLSFSSLHKMIKPYTTHSYHPFRTPVQLLENPYLPWTKYILKTDTTPITLTQPLWPICNSYRIPITYMQVLCNDETLHFPLQVLCKMIRKHKLLSFLYRSYSAPITPTQVL